MTDELEYEPPWYETVNMVVGCKQASDDDYDITSVLIFQAAVGELLIGFADIKDPQEIVWLFMLDFICPQGKHIPD